MYILSGCHDCCMLSHPRMNPDEHTRSAMMNSSDEMMMRKERGQGARLQGAQLCPAFG